MELHCRLGHISPTFILCLVRDGLIKGVSLRPGDDSTDQFCETCVHGKSKATSVPKLREGPRSERLGGTIHMDLWGPAKTASLGGASYMSLYMDDATRYAWVWFLESKDRQPEKYYALEALLKTQFDVPIKAAHSDRGGEYLGRELLEHIERAGTALKLTVHDTP